MVTRQSGRIDARRVSSAALVRWSSRVRRVGFLKNPILPGLARGALVTMDERSQYLQSLYREWIYERRDPR